jgi:hypothetical protein
VKNNQVEQLQVILKQKPLARHCPAQPDIVRAYPRNPQFSQSPSRTLSGPDGYCSAQTDIVRLPRTLSGVWIWVQRLVSWESSINSPPPPMALKTWPLYFLVEQAHILYFQRPISLSPRAFIPSSCLRIEWSKDLSLLCDSAPQARVGCWIFILRTCYSCSVAPRWLEISLELPLGVVSCGKVYDGPLCLRKERSKS